MDGEETVSSGLGQEGPESHQQGQPSTASSSHCGSKCPGRALESHRSSLMSPLVASPPAASLWGRLRRPSPSSFNHIPIVNLIQYYESVSNTSRVSNSPLESIDPRLLPPPSYEEVITNVSNPDEPPPTYMESF
mgnify:CR=1 FL=1